MKNKQDYYELLEITEEEKSLPKKDLENYKKITTENVSFTIQTKTLGMPRLNLNSNHSLRLTKL